MYPVINLHNDLLSCVEFDENKYGFHSRELRCALPQLVEGNVQLEVLTLATVTTPQSVIRGERQLKLYSELLLECADQITPYKGQGLHKDKIQVLLAIENASILGSETEPFPFIIERFDAIRKLGKILYISLTWNHENAFGGGNATEIGLKPYGLKLLEYLDKKNIAIDFSHTSDALAYDILNTIEKKKLQIPFIASHSNLRAICDVKRNLPDEIAIELFNKKAIMGLNFVRYFIGEAPVDLIHHIEHALKLGGEHALALGADFFEGFEVPSHLKSKYGPPYFFEELGNASTYPYFFKMIQSNFPESLLKKIAYENALTYINRYIPKQNSLGSLLS
jgi:membrane dipeptidase